MGGAFGRSPSNLRLWLDPEVVAVVVGGMVTCGWAAAASGSRGVKRQRRTAAYGET